MSKNRSIVVTEQIEGKIYEIRGQRIILDQDLSILYGVETKQLVRAVKRNIERFPSDFVFQLSNQEVTNLRCQIGTSSWGGRRTLPYAFTEHGAIMAASVISSNAAVSMSIHVVRAFVRARHFIEQHKELQDELLSLKTSLSARFSDYDKQFKIVFDAINQLLKPPMNKPKREIGFKQR